MTTRESPVNYNFMENRAPSVERPCRISVVGTTGSGKTCLARRLASQSGLPLYELDSIRRDDNGDHLTHQEFVDTVTELASRDEWIIDGHYRDVRELVWDRADMVVWLNYPMPLVLGRLVRRFTERNGPAAWISPALDRPTTGGAGAAYTPSWWHRLKRLARTLRERGEYGRLLSAPDYAELHIVELKSLDDTEGWLRRQRPDGAPGANGRDLRVDVSQTRPGARGGVGGVRSPLQIHGSVTD